MSKLEELIMKGYDSTEFLELIASPMMNATNVYRYSGIRLAESENLAEHTYEVMMLGYMMILTINRRYNEDLSIPTYLLKALHHDLEESMTGDVARPLKYHNNRVKKELDTVADQIASEMYNRYFSNEEYDYWRSAKLDKEGMILKVVDMLTVAFKAIKEVRILGNLYFMRVVKEVTYYISDTQITLERCKLFSRSTLNYLLTIIEGARLELAKVQEEYESHIEGLGITDRSVLK